MIRKFLFPLLAVIGAIFALFVVFWSTRGVPTPPIHFPPPTSPYPASIAGAGIIEANSLNVSVGTPFTEIVSELYVCEGDTILQGDPLFKIDTQSLEAKRQEAHASWSQAVSNYEDKSKQYSFYESLSDVRAVTQQAWWSAFYAMQVAGESVKVAEAHLKTIEVDIDRSTIRSPVDGVVLQLNTRPGEIAVRETLPIVPTVPFATLQPPLIMVGSISPLILRIDIDEDDAWRYCVGAKATAFVRGNTNIHFPLEFVRVEPYMIPKVSFTGETGERVDTRVLQVLYSFEWGTLPVYVGQVLDVFIEAAPFP